MELTPLGKGATWQLPGAHDMPISFLVDVSVTVPAGTSYEIWDPTVVRKLIELANIAQDVITTVHEDFRENIDFSPRHRTLVELGLMPHDGPWLGEKSVPGVIRCLNPDCSSNNRPNPSA